MKLVSACLCGVKCTWKGTDKQNEEILRMVKSGEAIPVCPEQFGGLPTPRAPAEQIGDRVITKSGADITEAFDRGASEVLKLAKAIGADEFIGKAKSPSCGVGLVYDGTFSQTLAEGDGATAKLLKENGLKVRSI